MLADLNGVTDMTKFVREFLRNESGASAAEYALILAIVGAGIAVAAAALGGAISGAMNRATTTISAATI
jgi:pilus assembly protein Flp/PilA